MKRLIKVLIFALAAYFVLLGLRGNWNGGTDSGAADVGGDQKAGTEIVSNGDENEQLTEQSMDEEHSMAETDMQNGTNNYAYNTLDPSGQQLYQKIYSAVITFTPDFEIYSGDGEPASRDTSSPDADTAASSRQPPSTDFIKRILDCVLADHPEIFYVDGFNCSTHTVGEEVVKITFTADYTFNIEEIQTRQQLLEKRAEQILAEMPETSDDYEKIRYLYEYLIKNTDYVLNSPENQSPVSVLLYGESVCQGYAKAFQYLCQKAGIPAVLVTGTTEGNGHAWNLVQADGDWYYVDVTWGDASYQMTDDSQEQTVQKLAQVNYDYLLVTTEQLARTHVTDSPFELPLCSSLKDNYYVRENLWFDRYDEEKLQSVFDLTQLNYTAEKSVTIKCANSEVYRTVYQELIEKQKIFDYIPDVRNLTYTCSEVQMTFTFWI